jgi:hypothetical protein
MIGKLFQSALCIWLSPLLVAQQTVPDVATTASVSGPAVLPKEKPVLLLLLEPVSSATAVKGQSVRMVVGADVKTGDGVVVIPKGTTAVGTVDWVRKAVPGKKDGDISIKPIKLDLPNSAQIVLRIDRGHECDALGTALLPLLPFALAVELVTMPFHKKQHEVGKDMVLEVCSEQPMELSRKAVKQPSGNASGQLAPQRIAIDQVCPNVRISSYYTR